MQLPAAKLRKVYRQLFEAHGPQSWWPAVTQFEVMAGAVLTQNTAWTNVERAIANLQALDALSAEAVLALPLEDLTQALRPSGYFNVKARRLQAFCTFFERQGGTAALAELPTETLRQRLLEVKGVGPETADDILLYAFARPVFVIDAYTRRIFQRLGLIRGDEAYEALRQGFEQALGPDTALFNEYHALLVRHAKASCARTPRCESCCLLALCQEGRARVGS